MSKLKAGGSRVVRRLFAIVGALLGVVVVMSLIRGAPLLEMVPLMLILLMSAVAVAVGFGTASGLLVHVVGAYFIAAWSAPCCWRLA